LLHRVNSASRLLLGRYRLLRTDFGEVVLVRSLQAFCGLVVLLLTDFLRSKSGIQIRYILLIAGVFARFRQEFLSGGLSLESVCGIPFCSGILTSKLEIILSCCCTQGLLGSEDGLFAAQFAR